MMKIEKSDKHTAYDDIKLLLNQARNNVVVQVNSILLKTYWQIGKIIVTDEQNNADRAEYGTNLLKNLSKQLTKEFGKGFSKSNLFNMRRFYLNWYHYSELLSISDDHKRTFYEKECENANGSVRELKRQEIQHFADIMNPNYTIEVWVKI